MVAYGGFLGGLLASFGYLRWKKFPMIPWADVGVPSVALGFFFFWGTCAAASALTVLLQRSPWEVNRCTLTETDRPEGCPKRAG